MDAQLARIRRKLPEAKARDKRLAVFGARKHRYELRPPVDRDDVAAWEVAAGVELPEGYKAFLTRIGNGGAGPFYGLFSLGEWEDAGSPTGKPSFWPGISQAEWDAVAADFDETGTDEAWDRLWQGCIYLGHQGCGQYHLLIIDGEHRGRVVNIDEEGVMPVFAFETSFLDWYERWLDEVIDGTLLQKRPYSFGFLMGGDDQALLAAFDGAENDRGRIDALQGLSKLRKIDPQSVERLGDIAESCSPDVATVAVQMLIKFDPTVSDELILGMIDGDDRTCLAACQAIFWYARDKAGRWADDLVRRLPTIENHETLTFAVYVLEDAEAEFGAALSGFVSDPRVEVQKTALFGLGKLRHRRRHLDTFLIALSSHETSVVHAALTALDGVRDKRLLPAYLAVADRFETDDHHVLTMLGHRLRDNGFGQVKALRKHLDPDRKSWLGRLFG